MKLLHGDCLEIMPSIPDKSIDLTVTSPPYDNLRTYNNSLEWGEHVWKPIIKELFRVTRNKLKTFNPIKDRKCKTAGKIKSGTIRCADGKMKRMSNEGTVQKEYGQRFNVWEISPQTNKDGHPAPFPESLANDHIILWSNEGDTVLDCFMGSGTTGKMALLNNRNFIGIEKDETYFNLAKNRIKNAQKGVIK